MVSKRKVPKSGLKSRSGDDDAALWQQIAGTVKPLKQRPGTAPLVQPVESVEPEIKAGPKDPPGRSVKPSPPVPTPVPPAPLISGAMPGIDKRTAQRLRRGQLKIDGRIDLHGMTRAEAYRNLTDFLVFSASAGRRCVLVITGKGTREGAEPGVLRSEFPRWLNEAALRPMVLSFTQAQPKDGGGGAFYVYLRKDRTQ